MKKKGKKRSSIRKWEKTGQTTEVSQIARKHMKRCLVLLAVGEMANQIHREESLYPTRMGRIKYSSNI